MYTLITTNNNNLTFHAKALFHDDQGSSKHFQALREGQAPADHCLCSRTRKDLTLSKLFLSLWTSACIWFLCCKLVLSCCCRDERFVNGMKEIILLDFAFIL